MCRANGLVQCSCLGFDGVAVEDRQALENGEVALPVVQLTVNGGRIANDPTGVLENLEAELAEDISAVSLHHLEAFGKRICVLAASAHVRVRLLVRELALGEVDCALLDHFFLWRRAVLRANREEKSVRGGGLATFPTPGRGGRRNTRT